ncbi:unnamed protein product, partial [Allacma fusca]
SWLKRAPVRIAKKGKQNIGGRLSDDDWD